jgi:anaerobic ribonucleoside-triphosphate reductase
MNLDIDKLINEYINQNGNRAKENANQSFSYPGLLGYLLGFVTSNYALNHIYSKEAQELHEKGHIHIHDANGLTNYCFGMDYEMALSQGIVGESEPPKHFETALGQLDTLLFQIAAQVAGAVAINSPDVLLAPYIKYDELTYKQVKQAVQQFIYRINAKLRQNYEAPFSNFQLDITVPKRLQGRYPVIAGQCMKFTYDDCQQEINWFNTALIEVMLEAKRILPFPVLNMSITKDFNWDNKLAQTMFTGIGQMGLPTINNYVNSDYDPESIKSLCCSLRLDMSKIMKSSGAFGANDNSGSIGVVSQNLALLGYLAYGDKNELKRLIKEHMYVSRNVLNKKREFIEKWHQIGMYPRLKQFIIDFHAFFSTIGIAGMNEMCLNFLGKSIDTDEGIELSLEILDYMNNILIEFQELDKDWYKGKSVYWNLELTPLEGATRRLAQQMHKYYPEAITSNGSNKDYITRGCWLPADVQYSLHFATEHQEKLQAKFSGGANFNYYLEAPIDDWKVVRSIVRKIVNNTTLPFISISPAVNICPICGNRIKSEMKCEHTLTQEEITEYKKQGVEIIESI